MDYSSVVRTFVNTVVYTIFGVVVFLIAFWAMVKISPFSIRKELEADHNVAVAILMASVIVGLSVIIASVVGG